MTTGFKNITIGRYKGDTTSPFYDHDFAGTKPATSDDYSGWVEGVTGDDKHWILYLDQNGRPKIFWPEREENGAVIGDGIKLDRAPGQFSGVFEHLGVSDDADTNDKNPEVVTSFPVFWPDDTEFTYDENQRITNDPSGQMRGIVFAVVPGEGSPNERIRAFIEAMSEGFGFPSSGMRRDKMRSILDSGDPESVVKRLREALDAGKGRSEEEAEEVRQAFERLNDSRTTLSAADGLPESGVAPSS